MTKINLQTKELRAYTLLTSLVICGLASSIITGSKVIHLGVNFPFSNLVFSVFTYPIVDCICELWGKRVARQTMWLGLGSQLLIALLIQLSILMPYPDFWKAQNEYQSILSVSGRVITASLVAFSISQLLDIVVYQRLKEMTSGKLLWLRSNASTYLGQALDSAIFIAIVFYQSDQKLSIFLGSVTVKVIISTLMTPIVYLLVIGINRYLDNQTFAFKGEPNLSSSEPSVQRA